MRPIAYLDDMLLVSHTVEFLNTARDTIFLLKHLGFVINQTKFQMQPVKCIVSGCRNTRNK